MKYSLNISGSGIGDNLVACYSNKNELRRNWEKDALDFVSDSGFAESDDWYPYFQIERANSETREISIRELLGGAER